MTTTNSSAKPRDVELVEKKLHLPKEKENTVDVNVTFCAYVGCDGISLMFLSLGVGGLFIYITYMYTCNQCHVICDMYYYEIVKLL